MPPQLPAIGDEVPASLPPLGGEVGTGNVAPVRPPHPEAKIGPAIPHTGLPDTAAGDMAFADPLRGAISPELRAKLTTPLAHPTGIDAIDVLTSPANIVSALVGGGLAAREARAAGPTVSRTLASLKGVLSAASPVIKYEIVRSGLRSIGLSDAIAVPTAMVLSGYQHGGGTKGATARPSTTPPPGVEPFMPNVSAGQPAYAPPVAMPLPAPVMDRYAPNVSTLTSEQAAAQAAVHNAPVAAEAAIPVSGPQGVPASAQVPTSFAALLKPPSPAQVSNAEGLVARGLSLADAARTVARGDAELGARIMTALQASHK